MVESVTKWGNMFDAPEQKLDDQSTQYGKTRVRRNESNLNDLDPDMTPCEIRVDPSETFKNIGNSFYRLSKNESNLNDLDPDIAPPCEILRNIDVNETLRSIGHDFYRLSESDIVL